VEADHSDAAGEPVGDAVVDEDRHAARVYRGRIGVKEVSLAGEDAKARRR
jgi:hypothetical protein